MYKMIIIPTLLMKPLYVLQYLVGEPLGWAYLVALAAQVIWLVFLYIHPKPDRWKFLNGFILVCFIISGVLYFIAPNGFLFMPSFGAAVCYLIMLIVTFFCRCVNESKNK